MGLGEWLGANGEVRFDQGQGVLVHGRSAGADEGGVGDVVPEEGI